MSQSFVTFETFRPYEKLAHAILVLYVFNLQLVSIVFWTVYALDRELMFPAVLDSIFPMWLNHAVHTAPLIFVLTEHMFVPITYPRPVVGSFILIGGIAWYLSWYLHLCFLFLFCCRFESLMSLV